MVDKDGNKVDIVSDLIRLEGQMDAYMGDIELLLDEIRKLESQKNQICENFDAEIPRVILEERKVRANEKSKQTVASLKRPPQLGVKQTSHTRSRSGLDGAVEENNRLESIYKMITINCKYKKNIQKLLKALKEVKGKKKELEEKYAQMIREVFAIKKIKLYKPVRGDVVDEMFAGYLNKAKLDIEVQRISASNYMFGTKKILAKIINGRLVIRVGGGYMNAEQFIE